MNIIDDIPCEGGFYNQSYSEADRNAESDDDAEYENVSRKVATNMNMGN